jgi:hypothetical protein
VFDCSTLILVWQLELHEIFQTLTLKIVEKQRKLSEINPIQTDFLGIVDTL